MSAPDARNAARSFLDENALDGLPTHKPRSGLSDPSFARYVAEFWRDYAGHWKASTQRRNLQAIDRNLVPYFGRHIWTIPNTDVLAWRESPPDRQGTFNRDIPVLAALRGYAGKLTYLTAGPTPAKVLHGTIVDVPNAIQGRRNIGEW